EHLEAGEIDVGNQSRLPFRDPDDDVDLVLRVIELDVEGADARVRKTAVAVERLDTLQVRVEGAAIEVGFVPPGHTRSTFGLKRVGERGLVNLLDAVEFELVNLDVAFLVASGEKEGNEGNQNWKPMTYSVHGDTAIPHAVPHRGVSGIW